MRRINLASWAAAVLMLAAAPWGSAWGQVPADSESRQFGSPEAMVEAALEMIDTGDLNEALALVRRAKMLKPTVPKIKLAEGLLSIERGQHLEAMRQLEEYNKTDVGRNDYRGYAAIGTIYKDSHMDRQAAPVLEKAKSLAPLEENGKPVRAEIAIGLATVYNNLGRKDQAIEAAKEAKRWAPVDPKIQLRLGQVAFRTQDFDTAAKAAERAIELLMADLQVDPLKKETYQLLGSSYQLMRNRWQREIAADPDDGLPYFKLAVTMREVSEVSRRIVLLDARESILQALTKEPENHEYMIFAARVEVELGALDEARERLARVLSSDPENQEAIKLRDSLQASLDGGGGR
ncbi:MAG: hypothetical protein JXQ75_13095 [Phycisphaerae bacterium]|nr:hypothetical protein [Phycisphaerae bacterium]